MDKIDKRYAWIKRHLLDFEAKIGNIFPTNWEVSERITVQFCNITRDELSNIMSKRKNEIDVKLLLFAISKTSSFEMLLSKRFTGITLEGDKKISDVLLERRSSVKNENKNLTEQESDQVSLQSEDQEISPFKNLIGACFTNYLDIYTDSIDRNLSELIERFIQTEKSNFDPTANKSTVFPSCADLFVFYKKCMVQCTQLSNGKPMYDLALIFKKYLREYASKVLESKIPKISSNQPSLGTSMSQLTRDLQNLSTAAQVFHSFMKEGDAPRFTKDEIIRICCILTTAEYCLETVEQLEDKLKEKVESIFTENIDLSEEKDIFHRIISNCIHLLVQDLESGCDAALTVMNKVSFFFF